MRFLAGCAAFALVSAATFGVRAETEITVYNNNLAMVKTSQKVLLGEGVNEVAFNEAAQLMKPESAFIAGEGIRVLEQNYEFAGVNYRNMLQAVTGKEVKTVRVNPENGKNIFEKAVLLTVDGGMPVLAFDYGVETNFPGRVVFDNVPAGLNSKPQFKAKVMSETAGEKKLDLYYLASGFSWTANYVARINNAETLSLLGRVSLNNASGSDFEKAKLSVVAGDVKTDNGFAAPRVYAMARSLNTFGGVESFDGAVIDKPLSVGGGYVYNLPEKASLKDGEIKQVSFLGAKEVKYQKRGVVKSLLTFYNESKNFFRDVHPDAVYHFANTKANGLGEALPKGKISFYEEDEGGDVRFVGEAAIDGTAEGQKLNLTVGRFFDVYAGGRIEDIQKSGKPRNQETYRHNQCKFLQDYVYKVVFEVVNKGKKPVSVVLKQALPEKCDVLSESLKSESLGVALEKNMYAADDDEEIDLIFGDDMRGKEGDVRGWRVELASGETKQINVEIKKSDVLSEGECLPKGGVALEGKS